MSVMNPSHSDLDSSRNSGNRQQPLVAVTDGFLSTFVRGVFPLLVCVSLSLGFQVPLFYNWSGTQQSDAPPIVGYAFAGFLIACCVSLLVLPLLPELKREAPVCSPLIRPPRFVIAVIIPGMMIVGLVSYRDAIMFIIGATSFIYPLLCAVQLGMTSRLLRWRIVSLYSCLYLPFIWVFTNDVFQGALKQGFLRGLLGFLPFLAGAPALLCSLFLGRFIGQQQAFAMLSAVVVAGLEVLLGLWIIQLGARRAIAYLVLLLAVSVITSFGFHALLRA
jgi:hypothetical protein